MSPDQLLVLGVHITDVSIVRVVAYVDRGDATPGLYPANDETRAAYQRWVKAGRPDEV